MEIRRRLLGDRDRSLVSQQHRHRRLGREPGLLADPHLGGDADGSERAARCCHLL